jgi:serine/threonine-protein kinase GIN4
VWRQYLSPERARGLPHDTRKSDIWALGVTFFEILVGRTPFEASEGEHFTTKEDLEKYWQRTVSPTNILVTAVVLTLTFLLRD